MAVNNNNGSRRRAQVKTETPISGKHISKKKIEKKKIEKRGKFQPGEMGACEAWLWTFTGPTQTGVDRVERVAAASLEEAVRFLRRRFPLFDIRTVEYVDLIPVVSCWPMPKLD